MNLATYVARRLALMVLVVFGVLIITFVVSHVVPADPVGAILGGNAPQEKVDALRRQLGLDKPLHLQFVFYIWGALHGDLGRSLRTGRPVWEDIQQFFPATVELTFSAIFLAILLGIPLGVISAARRNQVSDHTARVFSIVGVSMPVFWTGWGFPWASSRQRGGIRCPTTPPGCSPSSGFPCRCSGPGWC